MAEPTAVQLLLAKGMSRTDAAMVEEVSNHVLKEAMELLVRIGESTRDDLKTVTILIAAAKIQSHLESTGEYMLDFMQKSGRL